MALCERTAHIGQPLADEFLIQIDMLTGFCSHGLGNGDGLQKPQKGYDGCKREQAGDIGNIDFRYGKLRQSPGNLAHDPTPGRHDGGRHEP